MYLSSLFIGIAIFACAFSACTKGANKDRTKSTWTCSECSCSGNASCGCSPEGGCKCSDGSSCKCE